MRLLWSVCVFMYACMRACACIYILSTCAYMCAYSRYLCVLCVGLCVHVYVCLCACICVKVYVCLCLCDYICVSVCAYEYTLCVWRFVHVYVGLCVCSCDCVLPWLTEPKQLVFTWSQIGEEIPCGGTRLDWFLHSALCEMNESHCRKVSPPALFDVIG